MNDLIDLPDLGDNTPEFSVSEISMGIKKLIETKFDYIRVKGELGRVSRPASGHIYLDLKAVSYTHLTLPTSDLE